MSANNVVLFPRNRVLSVEERDCDQIVDIAMEQVMTAIKVHYEISIDERDKGLIQEAIRSKVYRDHSIFHPFQQIAERLITIVD